MVSEVRDRNQCSIRGIDSAQDEPVGWCMGAGLGFVVAVCTVCLLLFLKGESFVG